jgi:hypothetical protein
MRIKRIHVNQHNIRKNLKSGTQELPVLSVKVGKENIKGFEVEISGESSAVYRPLKPMSCGAKVWVETRARVKVRVGPEEWVEIT